MLGGGKFQTQNKLLVGSYINFVSAKDASINISDRGYVAVALDLDWGADGMIELTTESFQKDAKKLLGYDYTHENMKPLREIFKNATVAYVYRLNGANGVKASNAYATAKYAGVRGNDIGILVETNVDDDAKFDVYTLVDGVKVDKQIVAKYDELKSNDYVDFNKSGVTLTPKTQPEYLTGGANGGAGAYASNAYATAKEAGAKGNQLYIMITPSDGSTKAQVSICFDDGGDGGIYETFTVDSVMSLNTTDNDYVTFHFTEEVSTPITEYLTGGADGGNPNEPHVAFLALAESYAFNTLVCNSNDATIIDLYIAYTKRMRDEVGVKFQTVVYDDEANYEGIINFATAVIDENVPAHYGVFWVAGASAGCEINKTNTNKKYDGEYKFELNATKTELEDAIKSGKFVFHRVGDETRVLVDINSLVEYDMEKGSDFSDNKTIRILDQIGNDVALEFNTNFLGKIPNDAAGRISFWNALDNCGKKLQNLRAIQEWDNTLLKISEGETKTSVVVDMVVNVVGTMEKLYMTVRVV